MSPGFGVAGGLHEFNILAAKLVPLLRSGQLYPVHILISVSAQLGVERDTWELALNVENLLDEDYYTDVQTFPDFFFLEGDADGIIVIGTLGQPRLVTASLSYSF